MADQQNQPMPQYPQYHYQKKSSNWWVPVLIIAIVVILFFVLAIGFFSAMGSMFSEKEVTIQDNTVLHLKITGDLNELSTSSPFELFAPSKKATFPELLAALDRARKDDRIKGIFYEAGIASMGYAKAVELYNALEKFKESGKFIYAYIEVGTEQDYFLALPADKIFSPNEGIIEMNGFSYTSLFFKDMMNEIGVDFYVLGFEDFKSAGEMFSRNNYSDSARYQLEVILKQRMEIFANAVEKSRGIKKDDFYEIINRGVYTADSLKALGFFDDFKTRAEVIDIIKQEIFKTEDLSDKKIRLVGPGRYMASNPPHNGKVAEKDKQIAIIYGEGAIQSSTNDNPFSDEQVISSDKMVEYLVDAKNNDDIKAVILRVNTPGGSVIASDAIREEILRVRKKKPVYISMSDVSASGGYYIAMDCDTIIAAPETITGSIGVVMSIPNLSGLKKKIYLNVDTVSSTSSAQFLNGFYPMQERDKQQLYTMGKSIYDRFLNKVADARGMTYDEVRAIARGRVWTGEDAKRIGIVDVLGGYKDAISIAKRRIGVPDTMLVLVQEYPKKKDPLQELLQLFDLETGKDDGISSRSSLAKLIHSIGVRDSEVLQVYKSLPINMQKQIDYAMKILMLSEREKVIMAMPYYLVEE